MGLKSIISKLLGGDSTSNQCTVSSSVTEATYQVLKKQLRLPKETPSRNGKTRELSPHTVIVQRYQPYTLLPKRGNNPFSTIAETLWVTAGRNDLESLNAHWLPRSFEYSDDWNSLTKQGTWRAGYGPRIRSFKCRDGTMLDQLDLCLHRLRKQSDTRQALITISDPSDDKIESSKDYPCNLVVQFLIRDGCLNTHVYLRSNDIIFGFCINSFEWMFISKYLSDQLGLRMGKYHHTSSSLHLYENHYDKAQAIVDNYIQVPLFKECRSELHLINPKEFKTLCDDAFTNGGKYILPDSTPEMILNFSKALYSENALTSGDIGVYIDLVTDITDYNLVLSLLEYGQRKVKTNCIYTNPILKDKLPSDIYVQTVSTLMKFARLYSDPSK